MDDDFLGLEGVFVLSVSLLLVVLSLAGISIVLLVA